MTHIYLKSYYTSDKISFSIYDFEIILHFIVRLKLLKLEVSLMKTSYKRTIEILPPDKHILMMINMYMNQCLGK